MASVIGFMNIITFPELYKLSSVPFDLFAGINCARMFWRNEWLQLIQQRQIIIKLRTELERDHSISRLVSFRFVLFE